LFSTISNIMFISEVTPFMLFKCHGCNLTDINKIINIII